MINGSIQKEDLAMINIDILSIRVPKYIKQMLTALKAKIDSKTIIVNCSNILVKIMDMTSKQKFNKETSDLKNTIHQMDLTMIHMRFNHLS